LNRGIENIRNFYRYYTRDINYKDVEKLFKHDAPEVYDFYVKRMKRSAASSGSFTGKIIFIRDLFIEFLMQLSPARRLVYTIAFFLFIGGYINSNWQWVVVSFVVINLLIAFELADKITAKDELSVARDIQTGLMPKNPPVHEHFDICGYSESAREVGGDYYDFICKDNEPGKIFLVIGDISGKGMAAAILMVQVRAILHNSVSHHETPKTVFTSLSRNLKRVINTGSFFTAIIGNLNQDNSLTFCRAGHLPLIHYSRENNSCTNIIPPGVGIGIGNHSLFETTLEEVTIKPDQGDIFVFYTDGVIEARNEYLLEFGEERLKKIIIKNAHKPAYLIKDALLQALNDFVNNAPRHDDLTMIIVKAI
jgi:sigma-B regulation protein RsbU (phosphoserine phosphatase)